MKKIVSLSILLSAFIFCYGQTKPVGEVPVDLEQFNFATKISTLFPEKYHSKTYDNAYEIPVDENGMVMIQLDTTLISEGGRKAIGLEYRQLNWNSVTPLALFEKHIFQKINIATTLDGKIKAFAALADDMTQTDQTSLLKMLKKKYGTPKKMKNNWDEKLTILEWTKQDRIIRYVGKYDDERQGTMTIVVDQNKGTISEGEKEPHFKAYLFLINPKLKNEVFGKLRTGDFVYLEEKK